MSASDALIPKEFSDFRTRKFWEGFFVAREGKAFEWYGDWKTLGPLLRQVITDSRANILVPGCGNSCLSSELYDAGFEKIVNVDFSETCVREMLMQHVRLRPQMRWLVMDMTDLKAFADGSFDFVVDKGSLDALMGDAEDDEGTASGRKFLEEVKRVLCSEEGPRSYVIVTLAQDHVLATILHSFSALSPSNSSCAWKLTMHSIPPTKDMMKSPWQPFAIVATRCSGGGEARPPAEGGDPPPVLDIDFNFKVYKETEQMKQTRHLVKVWTDEAIERYKVLRQARMRAVEDLERSFSGLRAGQRIADVSLTREDRCRFKAAVLDAEEEASCSGGKMQPCAVFLVPQGREHEWLFSSEEGQRELLGGCQVSRLIIVSLLRDQTYGVMAEIQSELSPLVTELAPKFCRGGGVKIPYLTIQEGIGQRDSVRRCASALNGDVVVEDVSLTQGQNQTQRFRRMVFLESSNLIQSEALLVENKSSSKAKASKGGRKKGGGLLIDHAHLSCKYHHAISAGVSFANRTENQGKGNNRRTKVLLVGLGGGGLPMFLSHQFDTDVTVIELDPVVEGLAKDYFGFTETQTLRSVVGDGIKYIRDCRARSETFDMVVVDASGSSSESISCPPKAFLEIDFLEDLSHTLTEEGIMAVNIVSRSDKSFLEAADTLKSVFGSLFCIRAEDDVNKVVFAFRGRDLELTKDGVMKEALRRLPRAQRTKAHQKEMVECVKGLKKL